MKILKLIFTIIWVTVILIIGFPFLIILLPFIIIFWSRLSHKVKKGAFSIFKHLEPKETKETQVGEETISDTPLPN